jgi:hypothetical protein
MDFKFLHTQQSTGDQNMFKEHAFLKAIPEDFVFRSGSKKTFEFNPKASFDEVLAKIKGYKEVYRTFDHYNGIDVCLVADDQKSFAHLDLNTGRLNFYVQSSEADADKLATGILESIKEFEFKNVDKGGVWAKFSYHTADGVRIVSQFLKCPSWEEIKNNYPKEAIEKLEWAMKLEDPKKFGHLLIWHGPPGTGKTYAIRALMMAWRDRFNFIIVTDPENLTGKSEYYYGVCGDSGDDDGPTLDNKKKTLFIMEDSADLIIEESRSLHYDKIGKLLNMTDGLLGQGREDVFMITFNEELEKIDPAFARPGRCIMHHYFSTFNRKEVDTWFEKHENKTGFRPGKDGASLAELYAATLEKKAGDSEPKTRHLFADNK